LQEEQLNYRRFLLFPEGISNSSRFPEVVDTLVLPATKDHQDVIVSRFKIVQKDLKSDNGTLTEALDVAHNCPVWWPLATFTTMQVNTDDSGIPLLVIPGQVLFTSAKYALR